MASSRPSYSPALLTDLYQLTMAQAYVASGVTDTAVFELFVRRLPPVRNFLLAAGLEQVLEFLEAFCFTQSDLSWLSETRRFRPEFLDGLSTLRFTGDVHAMAEGTVFFPNEPIVRVTAPIVEAQLVESRLMNLIHYQTVVASKAARMTLAAPGKSLIDFGFRRAHGDEAGVLAGRASYIAGFTGSATVESARLFGIPCFGTMAHSFVQAHDREEDAFVNFARAWPAETSLLIDTYDTEEGARRAVAVAQALAPAGIEIKAVRLDSGDLIDLAFKVRRILDDAGLRSTRILASSSIDEYEIARIIAAGAPIDGFGVGTHLVTSNDAPFLDSAYKLQEYAGIARRKRSRGKATWPGRKQVFRRFDGSLMAGDVVTTEGDQQEGTPLVHCVMRGGRRLSAPEPIADIRSRAARNLCALPEALRRLDRAPAYPVAISAALQSLAEAVDERRSGLR